MRVTKEIGNGRITGLFLVSVFLFVSSFFIPAKESAAEWIPLFSGYWDPEVLTDASLLSKILGLFCAALLLVSMYIVSYPVISTHTERVVASLMCASIIFTNPGAVNFSPIYPAALALVWVQYFILRGERYFIGFFLISLASLFFAPLIWVFPIALVLVFSDMQNALRKLLESVGGTLVPYIIILSLRFICFNDVEEFLHLFAAETSKVSFLLLTSHLSSIFLLACIVTISLHAMLIGISELRTRGIQEAHAIKTHYISVVLGGLVLLLFSGSGSIPLPLVAAAPVAVLLSGYFSRRAGYPSAKIEWIIMLCAFAVARLSYFVS